MSVEWGFLVLRVYNWGWITVRYTEYRGVHYSGVSDVLKSMEKRSGLSELSVISWVSAVEGCPLSGFTVVLILPSPAELRFLWAPGEEREGVRVKSEEGGVRGEG